jgi:PAS domain S-box-containing protein
MSTAFDSPQLAATILAALPVAVTRCSADLRYLWVSDRYAEWLGIPATQIVGRRIIDVLGEQGLEGIRPYVEAVLLGKRVEYEQEIRLNHLGQRWIRAEYSPTLDASGTVDGWVAWVFDVTDRKRAEARLSDAHAALARLFELSVMPGGAPAIPALLEAVADTAIAVMDADMGTVQLYDEATDSLSSIAAHRGFGRPFLDHFAVVHGRNAACGEAMRRREQVIVEDVSTSSLWDDPSLRVLEAAGVRAVQSTLMMSRQGHLLGVISTHWKAPKRPDPERLRTLEIVARQAADALEHRRQEVRLLQADRRKDEFLAMLGHELRNPLAPIVIATEVMALRGAGALEEERKIIERQAKHMVRLVDDLLDVSRITRGKIELRQVPTALAEIVWKAAEMASPLLEDRSHRLTIEVPSELIIDVDPARMVQVVANLLTNAATYSEPGELVSVTSEATDETVTLRVADTGIGIAPRMLPLVFNPFIQEEQSLDRSRGGLGLGLAIVKSLVELHGGSVYARSEGPGRGSEFGFSLARSRRKEPGVAGSSTVAIQRAAHGTRTLIVDDNEDMAQALAAALTALGYEVRTAHDGPQALRIVEQFRPTVALLDIGLPAMDGYELARRLRQLPGLSDIRLIAVSGYGESPAVQLLSSEAGFEAHLVKPMQVEAIDELLRAQVGK